MKSSLLLPPQLKKKFITISSLIVLCIVICELILIVGSWLGSATSHHVTSLLSAEGVRWYVGSYSEVLSKPFLVWMLSVGIAFGIVWRSNIFPSLIRLFRSEQMEYIERLSIRASLVVLGCLVAVVLFLIFAPHAVLLSATGTISNSSFLSGFVTIASFVFSITALTYGLCASKFKTLVNVFEAMVDGVKEIVPFIILYLFIAHLILTIQYIVSSI